jgi:hypothetical protein
MHERQIGQTILVGGRSSAPLDSPPRRNRDVVKLHLCPCDVILLSSDSSLSAANAVVAQSSLVRQDQLTSLSDQLTEQKV